MTYLWKRTHWTYDDSVYSKIVYSFRPQLPQVSWVWNINEHPKSIKLRVEASVARRRKNGSNSQNRQKSSLHSQNNEKYWPYESVSDVYQQNRKIQRKCLRASRPPTLDLSLTLNRTMSLPVHSRIRSFRWHSKQLQVKPFHSRTRVRKRNTKTQILHPRRYLYYVYITMSNRIGKNDWADPQSGPVRNEHSRCALQGAWPGPGALDRPWRP